MYVHTIPSPQVPGKISYLKNNLNLWSPLLEDETLQLSDKSDAHILMIFNYIITWQKWMY